MSVSIPHFRSVTDSKVELSELMLPSHSNFSGKIHGGYILSLMDQIAFASASRYSGYYCVTASVETVNFRMPIEVGELVSLKASVNYVGRSSMMVGIRVDAENIQTGQRKHCHSSYFTMVAKDHSGQTVEVPRLRLESAEEIRRYFKCMKILAHKKQSTEEETMFNPYTPSAIEMLREQGVQVDWEP